MQITIDQKVSASVKFVDRAGNPAKVDGAPSWSSSDDNVASVSVAEDGVATVIAKNVGQTQISVTADADRGEGVRTITRSALVEVVSGEAVDEVIEFGEPEAQNAAAPVAA